MCARAMVAASVLASAAVGMRRTSGGAGSFAQTEAAPDMAATYLFSLPVEGSMEPDAFSCHQGVAFGITLPPLPGKNATFVYVKQYPWGDDGPKIYKDLYDASRHCLIFPALEGWSEEWRMLCRRHTGSEENGGWGDNRLFNLGQHEPCTAEPEVEPEVEERQLTAPGGEEEAGPEGRPAASKGEEEGQPAATKGEEEEGLPDAPRDEAPPS